MYPSLLRRLEAVRRQMVLANQEQHTSDLARMQYVFNTPARQISSLSSPSTHWLEYDHFFKVVQRLNRILDRKLLLIYTLPVSSIHCSNHQIFMANDFRVENSKNSRNNLI